MVRIDQIPRKIIIAISLGVILVVSFVAFYPSLRNEITFFDDAYMLTDNEFVRELTFENIQKFFSGTSLGVYVPVTMVSYAVEYHFFEYNYFYYHLTNLILHLGVTVLFYLIVLHLSRSLLAAFVAAVIFGVHPIHVESVAWIAERKDVLYSFFYLLSVWMYLRFLATEKKKLYVASIFCGLLSVLSKPMALSLPWVLLLFDWMKGRKIGKKVLWEKIPYAALIMPVALFTYIVHARVPDFSLGNSILIWMWTFAFYIKKFLFPLTLYPLYSLPKPISILSPEYIYAILLFAVILVALIRFRKNKWFVFSLLYYFLSIFFIFRYDEMADLCIVADRFMYLPCAGFCLLIGVGADRLLRGKSLKNIYERSVVVALIAVLVGALSVKTYRQTYIWKDDISLWDYVIKENPGNIVAHINRYDAYYKRGYDNLAMEDLSTISKLELTSAQNYVNRAMLYAKEKQYQLAIKDYSTAIDLGMERADIYFERGYLYDTIKDLNKSIQDYTKAIDLDPMMDKAYNNRGFAYVVTGDYRQALKDFNKAIKINPPKAGVYNNRGFVFFNQRKYQLALADFNKAIEMDDTYKDAYNNRASIYIMAQQWDKALEDCDKAISLDPDFGLAYQNRAVVHFYKGEYDKSWDDVVDARNLGVGVDPQFLGDLKRASGR